MGSCVAAKCRCGHLACSGEMASSSSLQPVQISPLLSMNAAPVIDFAGATPCDGEDAGQEPLGRLRPRQAERDQTS
jgi:hypothetical protein